MTDIHLRQWCISYLSALFYILYCYYNYLAIPLQCGRSMGQGMISNMRDMRLAEGFASNQVLFNDKLDT